MGQILGSEFKRKMYILVNAEPFYLMDVQFSSPSARGASTMVKAKLRNLLNGAVQDKTFRTSEKFDEADVEKAPASFLYSAQSDYHFMDESNYDQFSLSSEKLGELAQYLIDGASLQVLKFNDQVISIELPAYVELKVTTAEPAVKGASASGRSTKKAVLETGLEVQVPLYIEEGTVVRVNTQTGEVGGRA